MQRVRGRKATSNPTSPVTQPRRAISTPEDLALHDREAVDAGFSPGPSGGDATLSPHSHEGIIMNVEAGGTIPRARNRQILHAQSAFESNSIQDKSVYDNVAPGLRRSTRYATENPYQRLPVHANAHKPIGEREIPYGQ